MPTQVGERGEAHAPNRESARVLEELTAACSALSQLGA